LGEEEEGAPLAPGQDAPREGLGPAAEGLLQEEDEAGLRPKAELFQKPPQGPAAHRQGSLEEGRRPEGGDEEAGVGEEPGLGLALQDPFLLGPGLGEAGQGALGRGKALLQEGKDEEPEEVPVQGGVLVRGVLAPGLSSGPEVGPKLLPGVGQKGADHDPLPLPDARGPGGPLEELEEHGLRLVVQGVGGEDRPGPHLPGHPVEEGVAHFPGHRLQVLAPGLGDPGHLHPLGEEGEAQPFRQGPDEGLVQGAFRAQAVVQVGHHRLAPCFLHQEGQGHGVPAPGDGEDEGVFGGEAKKALAEGRDIHAPSMMPRPPGFPGGLLVAAVGLEPTTPRL